MVTFCLLFGSRFPCKRQQAILKWVHLSSYGYWSSKSDLSALGLGVQGLGVRVLRTLGGSASFLFFRAGAGEGAKSTTLPWPLSHFSLRAMAGFRV